ncbi:DUF4870 domain-containing protein [Tumebacillus flagellatus]|uniref:DUF4870 domain-containing protein n=1 Tax=Tumebacillus flagellatus TaxID=1157490 RepID=A0A074MDK3_9BACL|nr:DUF4870 domain-containing protein [Tumebacillus flagellatus]KEO83927.1 hypothetical protein EL26_06990 [Tumebacillus flagellatus]
MYVSDRNDRYWALAAHLSIILLPVIAPLVILILRANSRFVRHHAGQALLFHIIWGLLMMVSGWLCWILIGFPMLAIFGLMGIWTTLRAVFAALNEETYRYPITGNWM